jgi:DnaJ-like protein
MDATDIVISSNVPLRQDGVPRAEFNRSKIADKGIAVYFKLGKEQKVLACDAWDCWEHNLRALSKTVEAMRGLGRWKASEMIERAFMGFKGIPEKTGGKPWTEVLGIGKDSSEWEIKNAYKILAKLRHPDRGGSDGAFSELVEAFRQALADRG